MKLVRWPRVSGRPDDLVKEFCDYLKNRELSKAARIVEDVAKRLLEIKGVTPSSLERLAELAKQEVSDVIDLERVRSEIARLNIPHLPACVAEAMRGLSPDSDDLLKLRRLVEALVNFYKYYKR